MAVYGEIRNCRYGGAPTVVAASEAAIIATAPCSTAVLLEERHQQPNNRYQPLIDRVRR